jgi:hypothetical protein
MDLLPLVKKKCEAFRGTESAQGLEAVVLHIEIAEKHFEKGKSSGEYLYTDVIYRTNQAFEGALKEAYRVLAGKDPSSKSPFQIEKHLETSTLLKERVLSQFTNYRTEWRNKSTHDYQLFFSSQEALLAIVSVSAFFSILLDQMLEKHAYEAEKARLTKMASELFSDVANYKELGFMQQCIQLLTHFSSDLKREIKGAESTTEYELLGKLTGFIAAADPEIKITTEKAISFGSRMMRIDLFLEKADRAVIVELKRPSIEWARRAREGVEQVKSYMTALGTSEAIVFVPPRSEDIQVNVADRSEVINGTPFHIAVVAPGVLNKVIQPTA